MSCVYCLKYDMSLPMVELNCCQGLVHANCINVHLDHRRRCIQCAQPLHPKDVTEIRILASHTTTCAICQEPVVCRHRTTGCDHWYHNACLAKWVVSIDDNPGAYSCPVCREEIPEDSFQIVHDCIYHMSQKTLLNFPQTLDFGELPNALQHAIRRVLEDITLPEDVEPFDWNMEKILVWLYTFYEWEFSAGVRSYLRTEIRKIHRCSDNCNVESCLPRRWSEFYKAPMEVDEIL